MQINNLPNAAEHFVFAHGLESLAIVYNTFWTSQSLSLRLLERLSDILFRLSAPAETQPTALEQRPQTTPNCVAQCHRNAEQEACQPSADMRPQALELPSKRF